MGESTPQHLGGKVAPAVAMLLLGDSAAAGTFDSDAVIAVPEPAILGLLAIGAAAGGALAYRRHKNRNK